MTRTIFLNGFPTTKNEFSSWWERREEGDYLSAQFPNHRYGGAEEAWSYFAKSAAKLQEVFTHLERLGVHVNRQATLSDLYSSLGDFGTIVLLAHWRHTAYLDHHLLNCEGISTRIEELRSYPSEGEAGTRFSEILANHPNALKSDDRRDVIDCLDWLVSKYAGHIVATDSERNQNSKALQLANARRELDRLLDPFVASGNQLELWDGLSDPASWDIGKREEKISLDLLVCRSYDLAVNLKRSLGDKATIISGRLPVSIVPRALIAAKALSLSMEHKCEYPDVAISLREFTSQEWKGRFRWV